MTLTITLSANLEKQLHERASACGQAPEAFAHQAIAEKLEQRPTWDEILAPFRHEVAQSGMSDGDVESFFREVRDEVRRDKRKKSIQGA